MTSGWRAMSGLLLALACLWWPAGAQGAGANTYIGGREHARLTVWAAANGVSVTWLKRDEKLQLSKGAMHLVLTIDSREIQANGVAIWLSFPVTQSGGAVYVSQTDLQTTFRPLISPPRNAPTLKVSSICLDPGHGGRDPGNQMGSNQEKRYTLLLAKEVRDLLARAGFKVQMTRTTDQFLELEDRAASARRRKADLFLCLHFNAAVSSRGSVKGSEVYCLTPSGAASTNAQRDSGGEWCAGNRNNEKNLFLAYHLQKALTRGLSAEDRGVRRARFAVLRDATMPAALIEAGFMSHPVEGKKIFTTEYRRQMARAIVDGVLAYKREVER